MARIDDYKKAAELARRELSSIIPRRIAELAGAVFHEENETEPITVEFLGKRLILTWPDMSFLYEETREEVPIQEQVLILHYMEGAARNGGAGLTGEWMAFQDVPDGRFYLDAFQRRAKIPLVKTFGGNPERMAELAEKTYEARRLDLGDVSVSIKALPRISVALVLWAGDEEFPPEGNVLFDKNTGLYLPAEDLAWLSGMIVYPLMGLAAASFGKH